MLCENILLLSSTFPLASKESTRTKAISTSTFLALLARRFTVQCALHYRFDHVVSTMAANAQQVQAKNKLEFLRFSYLYRRTLSGPDERALGRYRRYN